MSNPCRVSWITTLFALSLATASFAVQSPPRFYRVADEPVSPANVEQVRLTPASVVALHTKKREFYSAVGRVVFYGFDSEWLYFNYYASRPEGCRGMGPFRLEKNIRVKRSEYAEETLGVQEIVKAHERR